MYRHLDVAHGFKARKFWRCSICGVENTGHRMNAHYGICAKNRIPASPAMSSRGTNPNLGRDPTTPAGTAAEPGPSPSSRTSLTPAPTAETALTAPNTESVPTPSATNVLALRSVEPLSEERMTPTDMPASNPPQEIVTPSLGGREGLRGPTPTDATPDYGNPPNTENSVEEEWKTVTRRFHLTWSQAVSNCSSLTDLESILAQCVTEWRRLASKRLKDRPEVEHGRRQGQRCQSSQNNAQGDDEEPSGVGKRRNQSRQMQRARQKKKFDSEGTSRIQQLFRIYPRRAVRQILDEVAPRFDGCMKAAEEFLRATYERPTPSEDLVAEARSAFDECRWRQLDEEEREELDGPPIKMEIEWKLRKASNTAPGSDGLEYRHLKAIDPKGHLLEVIYKTVWRFGIPKQWKQSRTISIHKKGSSNDLANFRPISLLPTMYKIFSAIVSQRLTRVAVEKGWISPSQKGFLPGIQGIQEHTQLLQTVIEEARANGSNLATAWLDLANAFGSVHHTILKQLLESLPIPAKLRAILKMTYTNNETAFALGSDAVEIQLSTGVRQGDALSSTIFNLAVEPLLRKAAGGRGFTALGVEVKTTAYADDIALVAAGPQELQDTLDEVVRVARILGMRFNAGKCASLFLKNGKHSTEEVKIDTDPLRCLGPNETENYLGIPMGCKLRFRVPENMVGELDKIASSKLAPHQKLEVLRGHLLPSLSHHLASGRVLKDTLTTLDGECRKFMGKVANVPSTATIPFFYADRNAGGLGISRLSDDADIWTIARASQLLSSRDPATRELSFAQLRKTIIRGMRLVNDEENLPVSEYLSGSTDGGLYRLRYGPRSISNLWTITRHATRRLGVSVDVSNANDIKLSVDDVAVRPIKAVRGLRLAIRRRFTTELAAAPHQGQVAAGLILDDGTKDIARLTSVNTELSIKDWRLLHKTRLDLLPLRGYTWCSATNKTCRRCGEGVENASHITNNCKLGLALSTKRHNAILYSLADVIKKNRMEVTLDKNFQDSTLRPDLVTKARGTTYIIDVVVAYDSPSHLEEAYKRKRDKYDSLGITLPLVIGSTGAWIESNDDIKALLGIHTNTWARFRRSARKMAIEGSMEMIRTHLHTRQNNDSTGTPEIQPGTEEEEDNLENVVNSVNSVNFEMVSIV